MVQELHAYGTAGGREHTRQMENNPMGTKKRSSAFEASNTLTTSSVKPEDGAT